MRAPSAPPMAENPMIRNPRNAAIDITMAAFPVIMLIYAWWKRDRIAWSDLKAAGPFFASSFVLGLAAFLFVQVIRVLRDLLWLRTRAPTREELDSGPLREWQYRWQRCNVKVRSMRQKVALTLLLAGGTGVTGAAGMRS